MEALQSMAVTAVVVTLGLAAPVRALDTCTASINPTNGTILVGAQNVSGTLLWGNRAGTVTNAFVNAGTCITGSFPLLARDCTLGTGVVAITPPPMCRLYLTDGSGTCVAFIPNCTPGMRPRFIDNGDGTVSDTTTGLMWEKKTTDGSLHGVAKTYTWSTGSDSFDGTAKTAFLDKLNDVAGGREHCFAGYCDWRLPSEAGRNYTPGGPRELETILDTTQGDCGGGTGACVYPALGPTQSAFYWSATTDAGATFFAWMVDFSDGTVPGTSKTSSQYVRAVRSGV